MKSSAILSDCQRYRYELRRTWDAARGPCVFVMLNPSTADHAQDDPTIRKCVKFATRFGAGGIVVVNLFAWRATDPTELAAAPDPVGPFNMRHVRAAAQAGDPIVLAWGTSVEKAGKRPLIRDQPYIVLESLKQLGRPLYRIGPPASGDRPRHPLFVPDETDLEVIDGTGCVL